MRKRNLILATLLVIGLLLAPACMAESEASSSWSLIEWVREVLSDLFGGGDEDGGGLPNAGPHADPAG